jgi:endonuclease I
VTFSETVQFGVNWFQLACTTSGTFDVADATVSGGPTSYGIDPDGDLVEGESCTLQLDAASILDIDGTADALVGDDQIAFTVAAPVVNAPPQVVSTIPVDGAASFPSAGDLSVTFSEPVNIASGAFTLACAASTGIVLSYPAAGTTISIDTGTALVHEDTCTFSIDEALVTDADGAPLVAFAAIGFTVATDNSGAYYDQVNDSSPEQLRCTLHETINDHTVYPYSGGGTSAWTILELAEEHPTDSTKIIDGYRNRVYTKVSDRAGTGSGITYNREHSWPNSLGFGSQSLVPYSDTHMLYLTDTGYNSDRGNMPYANCPQSSGCSEDPTEANNGRGGGSGTYPGNSNWYKGNGNTGSFEVWNARKGDFARTVMYMAIRYEGGDGVPDLELTDNRSLIVGTSSGAATADMGLLTTILEWHAFDPPDAAELERNEIVYSFQNNRNPFIDHPEWGTLALFQSSQPAECILGTPSNGAPVAVDDAYAASQDLPLVVPAVSGVLANDSDPDADALTAQLLANAASGIVSLATDGSFTYTANAGFCGDDSFTYSASDGTAASAAALVSLTVACTLPDAVFKDGFE